MEKERLYYVDALKIMGLFLVILAHVSAPKWLMQIRNFDVPMLVFSSAILASITYKNSDILSYIKKRFFRLVVPAWIFLVIFFPIQHIVYQTPTLDNILKAFLLQRDAYIVGMLWIVWVYMVCAIIVPFIAKMDFNLKTFLICTAILIVYDLICQYTKLSDNRFLYCTMFTVIPYGFITYMGFNYKKMSPTQKLIVAIVSLLIFIIFEVAEYTSTGSFTIVSTYKYPARIFYLSYAFAMIVFLNELFIKLFKKPMPKMFTFISRSSLWIYLWHILIINAIKSIITNDNLWFVQYAITIILSIIVTYMQNKIADKFIDKYNMTFLKVFKG